MLRDSMRLFVRRALVILILATLVALAIVFFPPGVWNFLGIYLTLLVFGAIVTAAIFLSFFGLIKLWKKDPS